MGAQQQARPVDGDGGTGIDGTPRLLAAAAGAAGTADPRAGDGRRSALLPQPLLLPRPDRGANQYDVAARYRFRAWSGPDEGLEITIEAGLPTDGQSMPRPLWGLLGHPFSADMIAEAVLHDALYASEYFRREWCDQFFRWTMREALQPELKVRLWYRAVRLGGHKAWEQHTEASVRAARALVRCTCHGKLLEPHSRLTPWERDLPSRQSLAGRDLPSGQIS